MTNKKHPFASLDNSARIQGVDKQGVNPLDKPEVIDRTPSLDLEGFLQRTELTI
jgi:hypothetical protein